MARVSLMKKVSTTQETTRQTTLADAVKTLTEAEKSNKAGLEQLKTSQKEIAEFAGSTHTDFANFKKYAKG
jgi:hypothetical protein